MKEFELANLMLNYVTNDDMTFKKALKKVFLDNQKYKSLSTSISSLVGCELRHHLLFIELTQDIKCENINLVRLALANAFFLKKYNVNDVNKYVKSVLGNDYTPEIEKLISYSGDIAQLLPLEKTSIEYASIRFNTPKWVVKMWGKHFGQGICFKALKANSISATTFIRENPMLNRPNILDDETLFEKYDVPQIYVYKGKSIRKLVEYQKGQIYSFNPVVKDLVDRYLNSLTNEYTLYSGQDDTIVNEMFVRSNGEKGINLIVPDTLKRPEIMRNLRVNKIKNINFFNGNDPIAYKTGISHPQEFLLVNPTSSSLDLIRRYPDYMLHFKRESLDQLIAKQKEVINDLSAFVMPGGILIYLVDTLNRKETYSVISSFIIEHPEYELIEERQVFPFDKENITLYYAVMKRKEN